jgi:hypothetical protein
MSAAAELIEELARYVERGEELDSSTLVEIHARIDRLKAECGGKWQNARAAKAADLLIEKLILQCAGNTSAALGDLGHVAATGPESSMGR